MPQIKLQIYEVKHIPEPVMHIKISFDRHNSMQQIEKTINKDTKVNEKIRMN